MAPHASRESKARNYRKTTKRSSSFKNPRYQTSSKMTTQGRDEKSRKYTLKCRRTKEFVPATFPAKEAISTQRKQSAPKILIPEGSITEYTNMQYRLSIRAKPGNLKCTHMPPNKQQYNMHECCKAVKELQQAMTSVISL